MLKLKKRHLAWLLLAETVIDDGGIKALGLARGQVV